MTHMGVEVSIELFNLLFGNDGRLASEVLECI